ncbi:MAG: hypothetical protein BJBARM5_0392 [Candidatus Parvarchaeum acidophilus ARMAN-5]|uniref:4-vinyl reductase 4VR domain-containing protein n=1 Tax=Candidatus Parvarchaeum acidophilus ARMAN-5 TaxID=662762 RepID=D6GV84_PARA5|nr:MAG: hypothetical protein BJBARM5_0392 [Candidatus Parvarchaeum acidophilus ARMAN-5]
MELDLEYDESKGIYLLNKIRVLVLPKGSLEAIQNSVNTILGLATKGIFYEVSSTVFYSFFQDLIKNKVIKGRGEDLEAKLFEVIKEMGLGRLNKINQDLNLYKISIEGNFNSFLNLIYDAPYCFNSNGLLTGIYRLITNKDVEVIETKCRTTGGSDADFVDINVSESKSQYSYIPSIISNKENESLKKVEIIKDDVNISINSIASEIIPVTYFPYLFSKLKSIIGPGVYGIESQAGKELAKLYQQYNLELIVEKYGKEGLDVLPVISGMGRINTLKTELNYLIEVDVYNSFNALHIDDSMEKRCFLLGSLISGLSYKLTGTSLKLSEKECSATNGEVCKFAFEQ